MSDIDTPIVGDKKYGNKKSHFKRLMLHAYNLEIINPKTKRKMNFLEERIQKDGIVKEGNVLKVDSFLNHQMDISLFRQIGEEFKRRFADVPINKILAQDSCHRICQRHLLTCHCCLSRYRKISRVADTTSCDCLHPPQVFLHDKP